MKTKTELPLCFVSAIQYLADVNLSYKKSKAIPTYIGTYLFV